MAKSSARRPHKCNLRRRGGRLQVRYEPGFPRSPGPAGARSCRVERIDCELRRLRIVVGDSVPHVASRESMTCNPGPPGTLLGPYRSPKEIVSAVDAVVGPMAREFPTFLPELIQQVLNPSMIADIEALGAGPGNVGHPLHSRSVKVALLCMVNLCVLPTIIGRGRAVVVL